MVFKLVSCLEIIRCRDQGTQDNVQANRHANDLHATVIPYTRARFGVFLCRSSFNLNLENLSDELYSLRPSASHTQGQLSTQDPTYRYANNTHRFKRAGHHATCRVQQASVHQAQDRNLNPGTCMAQTSDALAARSGRSYMYQPLLLPFNLTVERIYHSAGF